MDKIEIAINLCGRGDEKMAYTFRKSAVSIGS